MGKKSREMASRFTFSDKTWYTESNGISSGRIELSPDQVREHPNRFTLSHVEASPGQGAAFFISRGWAYYFRSHQWKFL
jgi:hypothetical protein